MVCVRRPGREGVWKPRWAVLSTDSPSRGEREECQYGRILAGGLCRLSQVFRTGGLQVDHEGRGGANFPPRSPNARDPSTALRAGSGAPPVVIMALEGSRVGERWSIDLHGLRVQEVLGRFVRFTTTACGGRVKGPIEIVHGYGVVHGYGAASETGGEIRRELRGFLGARGLRSRLGGGRRHRKPRRDEGVGGKAAARSTGLGPRTGAAVGMRSSLPGPQRRGTVRCRSGRVRWHPKCPPAAAQSKRVFF